jgi:hypothetical protein
MTIGTPTTCSVVVTKNTDGSLGITSGDAGAVGWTVFRPSYTADAADDYSSVKGPVWNEILRQMKNI